MNYSIDQWVIFFFIYCFIGWIWECSYVSIRTKKLTNRGFMRGPVLPIYGFGATFGNILMQPFAGSYMAVYLVGAVVATIFEYLVGVMMIKVLGDLWWDYNDKPYNFKGIICLESSIAWGFYAIGVVKFLNGFILRTIDKFDQSKVIVFVEIALAIAVVDYAICLHKVFKEPLAEVRTKVVNVYRDWHDRWF